MKKIILFTLLLTFAQAEVVLEPLTVTAATNSEQIVTDLPENVTVITADDIEQSHATTLPEALSRLAGIAFSNNGGLGKSTSMFLRGFDSKRTLVLIDGIRYNDHTSTSGAQFQDIILDEIERIEIIKGAQSGVWGADASAGVINIITKKAKKGTKLFANAEEGSYGFHKTAVSLSHKNDAFDIKLSSSQLKSEGFSAAAPSFGSLGYGTKTNLLSYENDAYYNTTTDMALGYDITASDRLLATYHSVEAYVEYDGGSNLDAIDKYNRTKDKFYSLSYNHNGEINDLTLLYSLSDFNRSVYGGYSGNFNEFTIKEKFKYGKDSFTQIGANYQKYGQVLSGGTTLNKNYETFASFLTNYNKFDSTILSESIRYDRFNTFGDAVTGKVGLKQFVLKDNYISLNAGTGYNVPSIYNLYAPSYLTFPSSFVALVGNSALTPEETKSYDISIQLTHLKMGYFYNEVNNLIDYVFNDPITPSSQEYAGQYQNVAGTSIFQGAELSYNDTIFNVLDIGLNYTYLDAKDASGKDLARRPKHQADLRLTYMANEDYTFLTHVQYIGTRYDLADNQGAQTGEYALVNLVLNYTIDKNFKTYLKLDNLFDTFYQVVDGYSTPGRSCYIGLSANY